MEQIGSLWVYSALLFGKYGFFVVLLLMCLKIIKPSISKRQIVSAKDKMNMVKIMLYKYSTYSNRQLLTVYRICMPAASCL